MLQGPPSRQRLDARSSDFARVARSKSQARSLKGPRTTTRAGTPSNVEPRTKRIQKNPKRGGFHRRFQAPSTEQILRAAGAWHGSESFQHGTLALPLSISLASPIRLGKITSLRLESSTLRQDFNKSQTSQK